MAPVPGSSSVRGLSLSAVPGVVVLVGWLLAGCTGGAGPAAASTATSAMTPGSSSPAPSAVPTQAPTALPTLTPNATVPPSATVAELAGATVPATCDMPAQQLAGGRTLAKYAPREGTIDTKTALVVDLDGDGAAEVVARYDCGAGGVGWPQWLLIYSHGPVLRGAVDLGAYGKQEHANVDRWSASGGIVSLTWSSYEGAGFEFNHHTSRLAMAGGKVTFADTKPVLNESREAEALVKKFLNAAVAKDTRTMKSMVSGAAYTEFARYGTNWSGPGRCPVGRDLSEGCETVIVSDGSVGLIFRFGFERTSTGTVRISTITFGGDAG